jgi:hypothetical protein
MAFRISFQTFRRFDGRSSQKHYKEGNPWAMNEGALLLLEELSQK